VHRNGSIRSVTIEPYPEEQTGDHARQVVQALIEAVPYVGGAVNRLVDLLIAPKFVNRRDDWCRRLDESFFEYRQRVEDVEAAIQPMQDDDLLVTPSSLRLRSRDERTRRRSSTPLATRASTSPRMTTSTSSTRCSTSG
jgi:hypothetical protein